MMGRARSLLDESKEGSFIMLDGEAGMGKTRIMEEFKSLLMLHLEDLPQQPGLLIFSSRGSEATSGQVVDN